MGSGREPEGRRVSSSFRVAWTAGLFKGGQKRDCCWILRLLIDVRERGNDAAAGGNEKGGRKEGSVELVISSLSRFPSLNNELTCLAMAFAGRRKKKVVSTPVSVPAPPAPAPASVATPAAEGPIKLDVEVSCSFPSSLLRLSGSQARADPSSSSHSFTASAR